MYSLQKLHFCLFSFLGKVILAFFFSIFSVHSLAELSSTNLFTNLFLHFFLIFIVQILTKITGFITFALTVTKIPNKSFIAYAFINQFFAFAPAFIIIPTLLVIRNTTVKPTFTLTRFRPFFACCFISSQN